MAIAFGGMTSGNAGLSLTGPVVTGSNPCGLALCIGSAEATAATWNGVSMTKIGGGAAGFFARSYALFAITAPSSAGTVTFTGGGTSPNVLAWYHTGDGAISPRGSVLDAIGNSGTGTRAFTTVAGDVLTGVLYTRSQDITVTSGTPRGAQQNDGDDGRARLADITASGVSTSLTGTWTATNWLVVGVVLQEGGASTPTVPTQPAATTVVRTDPARAARAMAVAATTNGAGVSVQWYRGASGVTTTPVNAGGIYAISTTGTTSLSSTLTITPTDNSLSGQSFWCRVTDSAGSTDSAAAVLTVRTGVVLSKSSGTTGAGGVDTLTAVSDLAQAAGEVIVLRATDGALVERTTARFA
jgi:hypothetical protein